MAEREVVDHQGDRQHEQRGPARSHAFEHAPIAPARRGGCAGIRGVHVCHRFACSTRTAKNSESSAQLTSNTTCRVSMMPFEKALICVQRPTYSKIALVWSFKVA